MLRSVKLLSLTSRRVHRLSRLINANKKLEINKSCNYLIDKQHLHATMAGLAKAVDFDYVKMLKDKKDVLLVDVREPEELKETGSIPGSINIPLGQLEQTLANMSPAQFEQKYKRSKPNRDSNIVFHCRSGKRSTTAQEIANKLGYKNIMNYTGGWLDWESKIKKM